MIFDNSEALLYEDSDAFYGDLDRLAKQKRPVAVSFERALLDRNSKLWRRLRRCRNWREVERQLISLRTSDGAAMRHLVTAGFKAGVTTGEIVLLAWIATLVASLLFYGVYKGYDVEVDVDTNTRTGRLKFRPHKPR